MITIRQPHLMTTIEIWSPKYSAALNDPSGEWQVLLSKRKVANASPVVLVGFTKAKHLLGQRFAIPRKEIERCESGTNGKIDVWLVPFNKLENWQSTQEMNDMFDSWGW